MIEGGAHVKLDEKDRIIITMYAEDPNISQEKIAARIKMSQPSVATRVAWLRKNGGLEKQMGVNPVKMGFYLSKVDVTTMKPDELLKMFLGCPYFAHGFSVSGNRNVCLFFFSESMSTLESIVNCHIRSLPSVKDVDFNIVITSAKDFIIPVRMAPEECKDSPCKTEKGCPRCPFYADDKCMGCRVTGQCKESLA